MDYSKFIKKVFKKDVDTVSDNVLTSKLPPKEEIEAFKRNAVWNYIADTIDFRLKSARDDLENQNIDIDTIRVYQGRIEELRFIGCLPDFLIDNFDLLKAEISAKVANEEQEQTKKEAKSWIKS